MNGVNCIKMAMEMSNNMTMGLIDDMKDAPLTFPTSKGGSHPLWVLGHLTYSEANLTNHMMLGEDNPLADWKEIFGEGTTPSDDASLYPPIGEVFAKAAEIRENTMKLLNSLSDDDLDKPALGCPDDQKDFFGTYAQCLTIVALHSMMHRGNVADSRRMLGRAPLMA